MKNLNQAFISLFCLLFIASCGQGGKTNASLKVSSSFALSNSGFNGGYVLYGKDGTKSFSRAVPYTAGAAGNVVDITLPNGKWSFYVTAWKNSSTPMTGDILCGETQADLNGSDIKIELSPTQSGCDSTSFVNNTMRATTGANKVKKLALISCNGFYEWSGGTPLSIVGNSTAYNFCSSMEVPLDLRNQAKSFKVLAKSKSLANLEIAGELSSPCLAFNDPVVNGVSSVRETDLRIPSSNTPVKITLFQDEACSEVLSEQPMLEGLSFNYEGQKFFLNNFASDWGGLVVPSNQARKGYSHFIEVMPKFKCSTAVCVAQHMTAPYEIYLPRPLSASPVRLNLDYDPRSIATNYIVSIPGGQDWTFAGGSQSTACGKNDETFYCEMILDSDCSDLDSPNCFTGHGSSPSFHLNLQKNGGANTLKRVNVFKNRSDFSALKTAFQFTGRYSNSPLMNDHDSLDEEDVSLTGHYGLLDTPRMLLSPAIGGNVSFPGQTCASASGTKQIELREEGTTRTYELSVENNRDLGTGLNTFEKFFFCLATSFNTGSCFSPDAPYEKRFTVRRLLSPGNWEKFLSMEFSCDPAYPSGRFHEENAEFHSGSNTIKRREKTVIAWFTPPGKERIELYNGNREYDASGIETQYGSSFARLFKTSASNFSIDGMNYSRRYSGSTFEEGASRFFIQLSTSFLEYDFLSIHKPDSTMVSDLFNSIVSTEYEIEGEDIRPVADRANVNKKLNLNDMTFTPGSYGFTNAGPTATSLGNLPLRLDSMKPTPFYGVFNDGFY